MSTTEQELFTIEKKSAPNPVCRDGKRFPPAQDDPAPIQDYPAKTFESCSDHHGRVFNPPPSGGGGWDSNPSWINLLETG